MDVQIVPVRPDQGVSGGHFGDQSKRQSRPQKRLVIRQISLALQRRNITRRNVSSFEKLPLEDAVQTSHKFLALTMNFGAEFCQLIIPWTDQVFSLIQRKLILVRGAEHFVLLFDDAVVVGDSSEIRRSDRRDTTIQKTPAR